MYHLVTHAEDPHCELNGIWDGVTINMEFVNHYWGNLLNNIDNTKKYKTGKRIPIKD